MGAVATLPMDQIVELCRRYHVRELSLFGSRARGDYRDDSDIDLLISFEPGSSPGLFGFVHLKQEFEQLLGRPVDLVSREGLRNPYRRASILGDATVIYAAG